MKINKYGNNGWDNTVYGYNWFYSMSSQIIIWTFYIDNINDKQGIIIGITSNDECSDKVIDGNDNDECIVYGFENNQSLVYLNAGNAKQGNAVKYGIWSTIELKLYLGRGILSCNVDESDHDTILFSNI